jgi:hypothetical protein
VVQSVTIGNTWNYAQREYSVQQTAPVDRSLPEEKVLQDSSRKKPEALEALEQATKSDALPKTQKPQPRTTDLENISLKFNKEDSFAYIGKDSDLDQLDVQKAISDMKRDQILQGYQYFVGHVDGLLENSEDGTVFRKQ